MTRLGCAAVTTRAEMECHWRDPMRSSVALTAIAAVALVAALLPLTRLVLTDWWAQVLTAVVVAVPLAMVLHAGSMLLAHWWAFRTADRVWVAGRDDGRGVAVALMNRQRGWWLVSHVAAERPGRGAGAAVLAMVMDDALGDSAPGIVLIASSRRTARFYGRHRFTVMGRALLGRRMQWVNPMTQTVDSAQRYR